MAARLGGRAEPSTSPNPVPGEPDGREPLVPARDAAVPVRARASTWGTSSTTRWATSRPTCGGAAAGTSCARWAGTRSGCRPRTRRSGRACIRASTIERNIETMRAQMKRLGWAIDWDREVAAHQPTFYRWTQWLFQQFVAHDLCYRKEGPVNWCPNDQTVIANEYVVDGRCERCGAEVELRNMTQWFMRTTAYADELLEYDCRTADWPERDEGDPAQLDRPLGGRRDPLPRRGDGRRPRRLHDACRHALRRDLLRRRARASVRRGARERGGEGVRAPRRRAPGRGARGRRRRRPASSPASTRSTRSTTSACRSGSPTTS